MKNLCRELSTGAKAEAMFQACVRGPSGNARASALRQLRRFMAERGIPWPSKPNLQHVTPLGVLIELAYTWHVPLWFSVRFTRKSAKPGGDPTAVIIEPGPYALVWQGLHKDITERGDFYNHWSKLHAALSDAGNDQVNSSGDTERAEQMSQVDNKVLGELATAQLDPAGPASDELQLGDVDVHYTPHIKSNEWLEQLRKHVIPLIGRDTLLRLSNRAVLKAVEKLFSLYDPLTLLEHAGWYLARNLAPLADASLLYDRYVKENRSEQQRNEERSLFCVAQVEPVFRLLVISLYAVPRFSPIRRERVNKMLLDVRDMVASKVAALPWLDELYKKRAQQKLSQMKTALWPPDSLLANADLSATYTAFVVPNESSSVMGAWIQNVIALHELRHRIDLEQALRLPGNLALPLLQYDYLANEVRISAQALSPPVYFLEGTLGMLYGGLGYMYASEVVKALDAEGSLRNAEGRLAGNDSWLSPRWADAIADKEGCLGESAHYFPEIPAIEVAYASLENALRTSDTRLLTARATFSERRLFYITMCYLLCTGPTPNYVAHPVGGNCNKAVANFPRFADDFGCTGKAKMRRERPCVFFV
ncbi:hypothetical protein HPB48_006476 [Haemaphysalis longicornis]|uniref:Peptidase M13 N-terminal domain-containing protein n=1 Tax=Haemaphysalis longicornis TaxID=44386 RepID=A0A9J6FJW4_HAELO|nr:hypothetical protein HPB48_006476 [Haemaphysalis longicornis]